MNKFSFCLNFLFKRLIFGIVAWYVGLYFRQFRIALCLIPLSDYASFVCYISRECWFLFFCSLSCSSIHLSKKVLFLWLLGGYSYWSFRFGKWKFRKSWNHSRWDYRVDGSPIWFLRQGVLEFFFPEIHRLDDCSVFDHRSFSTFLLQCFLELMLSDVCIRNNNVQSNLFFFFWKKKIGVFAKVTYFYEISKLSLLRLNLSWKGLNCSSGIILFLWWGFLRGMLLEKDKEEDWGIE